jgi:DNA-binding MarR family transcriptional regulator
MARFPRCDDFRETIPFAVHRLAARAVAKAADDFAELGLTVSEARVVLVTFQHGPIRVSLVAEYTALGLSTLSHMLGRLERAGLIARKRVTGDARSVDVVLTTKGSRVAQAAEMLMVRHQEELIAGFSAAEVEIFRRLLQRSYESIAAITADAPATATFTARRRGLR